MSAVQETMRYAVVSDHGELVYFGVMLPEAESTARTYSKEGLPAHLLVLKESYEWVTTRKMNIIKQGERSERGAK